MRSAIFRAIAETGSPRENDNDFPRQSRFMRDFGLNLFYKIPS
ncbi:hypothetical protein CKA32_000966 [Geitlerinema sp. FC II]|nr:hypothetical protein CKA32_000966 [Geitlerinema sp. FC II]